jgi:adenylate kinase family enzyme
MAVKVFILGRPGSGKSVAARRIAKLLQHRGWSTTRITDYDLLYDLFQREKFQSNNGYKKFCPTDYEGFDVVDFSILDAILQEIEKKARKYIEFVSYTQRVILIEFARDEYLRALTLLSDEFLRDAYFLFLDASIDTCIERIHKRVTIPPTKDNHFVSDEIIKTYYYKDYDPFMTSNLSTIFGIDDRRIWIIDNTGSWKSCVDKINAFVKVIFENEEKTQRITGPLQNVPSLTSHLTTPICTGSKSMLDHISLDTTILQTK